MEPFALAGPPLNKRYLITDTDGNKLRTTDEGATYELFCAGGVLKKLEPLDVKHFVQRLGAGQPVHVSEVSIAPIRQLTIESPFATDEAKRTATHMGEGLYVGSIIADAMIPNAGATFYPKQSLPCTDKAGKDVTP